MPTKKVPSAGTLTVLIHTKNAAATLKQALESALFADQIIVVDMHSADETISIAQEYTSHIFTVDDVGYVEPARNFGLSQVKTEWVLILDADEEVSDGLSQKIKELLSREKVADGYYLPRQNVIFGKPLAHTGWWPDWQLRLFKVGRVSWSPEIHSVPETKGEIKKVPAEPEYALIHHNYQTVRQFVDRLNRYTDIEASKKDDQAVLSEISYFRLFSQEFLRRLFAQNGLDDGRHGVALSLLQSMYPVIVALKQWQTVGFPEQDIATATIRDLVRFRQELAYWLADWQVNHTSGAAKIYWQIRRKFRF